MTVQTLLVWLVVGAVAGWLAGQIVKGHGFGLVGNIIVGIVGAFLAGWLLPGLGARPGRHRRQHRLCRDRRDHPVAADRTDQTRIATAIAVAAKRPETYPASSRRSGGDHRVSVCSTSWQLRRASARLERDLSSTR
ncbi:GlsB/YeaQ/YmgE family stress response membrane protein [Tahibacter sp. UC22_41]|uniref:GlsB/YeaQ/YmgE family stress response membrane protein n=1 Tax=Tahibacter sp. UC22_41 TaxID=3350178 RepID=UPI0036DE63B5